LSELQSHVVVRPDLTMSFHCGRAGSRKWSPAFPAKAGNASAELLPPVGKLIRSAFVRGRPLPLNRLAGPTRSTWPLAQAEPNTSHTCQFHVTSSPTRLRGTRGRADLASWGHERPVPAHSARSPDAAPERPIAVPLWAMGRFQAPRHNPMKTAGKAPQVELWAATCPFGVVARFSCESFLSGSNPGGEASRAGAFAGRLPNTMTLTSRIPGWPLA